MALIKGEETLRQWAYWDRKGGVWTIGWGHTRGVASYDHMISVATAEKLFLEDLDIAETDVKECLEGIPTPLSQPQYDALVSFVFSIGRTYFATSTMRRFLLAGSLRRAADEFPRWNLDGGVVMAGLIRRRAAERSLFLEGTPA